MLISNICGRWFPCLAPVDELEPTTEEVVAPEARSENKQPNATGISLEVYFSYLTSRELAAICSVSHTWRTRAITTEQQRAAASTRLFGHILRLEMQNVQVITIRGENPQFTINGILLEVYFSYLNAKDLAAISGVNRSWHRSAVMIKKQRSLISTRRFDRSLAQFQSVGHILDALHSIKQIAFIDVAKDIPLFQLYSLMHIMKYTEMPMHFEIFPALISSFYCHTIDTACPNPLDSVLMELEAYDDRLSKSHATVGKVQQIIWG